MCGYCGCTETNEHTHHHDHTHEHTHAEDARLIQIEQDILAENKRFAAQNRAYFTKGHVLAINLMSSPGAGKTTLLTETLLTMQQRCPIRVIEGDQQTDLDAKRIAATGVSVKQINTGKGCHLDAHRVGHAVTELAVPAHSILFIENVGNLVCPALFDLGETAKVVILSVAEGDDKPLKYPHMFAEADLLLINKIDLLPYVSFNVAQCIEYARRVNPKIAVLQVSAKTLEGMPSWYDWLSQAFNKVCVSLSHDDKTTA